MTPATGATTRNRWWSRLPVGLRTDLPVLLAIVVCWLTLPILLAHVLTGVGMVLLIGYHLRTRRARVRRLFRSHRGGTEQPVRRMLRRIAYWALLAATLAMLVSGLLRLAGIAPQYAQHAAASYAMLTAAVLHLVAVWPRLRSRLRTRAARAART